METQLVMCQYTLNMAAKLYRFLRKCFGFFCPGGAIIHLKRPPVNKKRGIRLSWHLKIPFLAPHRATSTNLSCAFFRDPQISVIFPSRHSSGSAGTSAPGGYQVRERLHFLTQPHIYLLMTELTWSPGRRVYLEACRHPVETGRRQSVSSWAWAEPSSPLCVWPAPPAPPRCGCLHGQWEWAGWVTQGRRSMETGRYLQNLEGRDPNQNRTGAWLHFLFPRCNCVYAL